MLKRIALALLLALIVTPSFAQSSKLDREHKEWIASVLRSTQTVKPGMTREQLLKFFTTEGGLSNRLRRTYVYRQCPYIKVSVEFIPVGDPQNISIEKPTDQIRTISQPFLEYAIID